MHGWLNEFIETLPVSRLALSTEKSKSSVVLIELSEPRTKIRFLTKDQSLSTNIRYIFVAIVSQVIAPQRRCGVDARNCTTTPSAAETGVRTDAGSQIHRVGQAPGGGEFGAGRARFPGDSPIQGTSRFKTIAKLISKPLHVPQPVKTSVVIDEISPEEITLTTEYIGTIPSQNSASYFKAFLHYIMVQGKAPSWFKTNQVDAFMTDHDFVSTQREKG